MDWLGMAIVLAYGWCLVESANRVQMPTMDDFAGWRRKPEAFNR